MSTKNWSLIGMRSWFFFAAVICLVDGRLECQSVFEISCGSCQCCSVLENVGGALSVNCSGFGPFAHRSVINENNLVDLTDKIIQISSGGFHTCSLFESGQLKCLGANFSGQLAVPAHTNFLKISSGYIHTCGVTYENSIICWGKDTYGQCTPPRARFVEVGSGEKSVCQPFPYPPFSHEDAELGMFRRRWPYLRHRGRRRGDPLLRSQRLRPGRSPPANCALPLRRRRRRIARLCRRAPLLRRLAGACGCPHGAVLGRRPLGHDPPARPRRRPCDGAPLWVVPHLRAAHPSRRRRRGGGRAGGVLGPRRRRYGATTVGGGGLRLPHHRVRRAGFKRLPAARPLFW